MIPMVGVGSESLPFLSSATAKIEGSFLIFPLVLGLVLADLSGYGALAGSGTLAVTASSLI